MAGEVKELSVFPMGEENPFGQYFTGKSYRKALSSEQVKVSNITFTPGCRNHWHIHHAETGGGQMLLVTAGRGWYQEWGKPARELHPGDVVNIPANVKHWHGAARIAGSSISGSAYLAPRRAPSGVSRCQTTTTRSFRSPTSKHQNFQSDSSVRLAVRLLF